jgi:hypothetical protein
VKKLLLLGAVTCLFTRPNTVWSETATYSVNQADSQVRIVPTTFENDAIVAGTRFLNVRGIAEQSAGSLESKISGTLTAEVSGSTLTFAESALDVLPNPNGPFLPDIPDSPGQEDDFGAFAVFSAGGELVEDGEFAMLDSILQLAGGTAVIGNAPSDLQFRTGSGILNYRLNFPLGASSWVQLSLDPQITANRTQSSVTGNVNGTIHIPFHIEFPYALAAPSDYNENLQVDAADYVLWRNAPELYGNADGYTFWRLNFGRVNSLLVFEGEIAATRILGAGGAGPSDGKLPEPGGLNLAVLLMIAAALRRFPKVHTMAVASYLGHRNLK